MLLKALLLYLGLALAQKGPEEGKYFEGDMVLSPEEINRLLTQTSEEAFNAKTTDQWPNGVLIYEFHHTMDQNRRQLVQQAFDEYTRYTCIRFRRRTTESNYAEFINQKGSGCSSHVGMYGYGRQYISIGDGCDSLGVIIHEIMHALGFYHEQSRWDRDEFVNVYDSNIHKDAAYNFNKYHTKEAEYLGETYDYDSIMHYDRTAFAKDYSKPTIESKVNPDRPLGQRYGFSPTDVRKLNKMYNCRGYTAVPKLPALYGECIDKYPTKECEGWASYKQCDTNPAFMLANCKKTCTDCENDPPCRDELSGCKHWTMTGYCSGDGKRTCRVSCQMCRAED